MPTGEVALQGFGEDPGPGSGFRAVGKRSRALGLGFRGLGV